MRTTLPAAVSSFVGRGQERAELAEVVQASRLVTLNGGAGVGKSRLALEVAGAVHEADGGPVAYVDLAAAVDPPAVDPPTVDPPAVDQAFIARLGGEASLLVLDNAEHVVEACAEIVVEVLRASPALRVLVTSRQPLGVPEEVVRPVAPLSLPEATEEDTHKLLSSEAVELFVARARALRADFPLDPDTTRAVAEICRRLEGNPLAIELAAGRVGVLSAAEIAEHLDELFDAAFEGSRTAHPRHQSLEAAIAWSYRLLPEAEQVLLRRLAVFAGGFIVDAAKDVCGGGVLPRGEVPGLLDRLVAKSLVEVEGSSRRGRCRLTEPTRRYAWQRLVEAGEAAELEALQAAWCAVYVEEAGRAVHGHEPVWVERLEAEHDNVGAAFAWAVGQGRAKLSLRLARGQMLFWQVSGRFGEARDWLDRVLSLSKEAPAPLRAAALHDAGYVTMLLGDFATARAHLEEAVALFAKWPHTKGQSSARTLLGFVCSFSADRDGLRHLEQTIAHARVTGDDRCLAESLIAYGRARLFRGGAVVGRAHFQEAVELAGRMDDGGVPPSALLGLGWAALAQGHYAEAEAYLAEGLSRARFLTDAHSTAVALMWTGELARRRGQLDEARPLFEEALELGRAMATPYPLATSLLGLGRLVLADGDAAQAGPLFEEAVSLARRAGLRFLVAPGLVGMAQVCSAGGDPAGARSLLRDALEVADDCGDRWGAAEVLHERGRLARHGGHHGRAAAFHHQALGLQQEIGDTPGVVASLEALAGLALVDGSAETAACLFGAAAAARTAQGYPQSPLEVEVHTADLALLEERMDGEELAAAWGQGGALSLAEAVAYASRGGGQRPKPTSGWASLSPAECEVAALAEAGLTNREIAQRLLLSPETVKSHVSKAFAKLGVSTRQELAQAVRQRMREPEDD